MTAFLHLQIPAVSPQEAAEGPSGLPAQWTDPYSFFLVHPQGSQAAHASFHPLPGPTYAS